MEVEIMAKKIFRFKIILNDILPQIWAALMGSGLES